MTKKVRCRSAGTEMMLTSFAKMKRKGITHDVLHYNVVVVRHRFFLHVYEINLYALPESTGHDGIARAPMRLSDNLPVVARGAVSDVSCNVVSGHAIVLLSDPIVGAGNPIVP